MQIEVERLAAAGEVTLPRAGLILTHIRVYGGATPGSFSWLYDGAASAHFPSPTNGTRGHKTYKVNHKIEGASIPAAVFTFNGGLSVVELVFSDTAPAADHKPIKDFRALRFARTDAGAVTADVTVNFAGGNGKPRGIVGLTSASAGRARLPPTGSLRQQVEAVISDTWGEVLPVADIPESASLTLELITDGASTSQYIVYY